MRRVPVELGDRRYDVVVGAGASAELAASVSRTSPRSRRAVVVSQEAIVVQPWFADIDPGMPFDVVTIGDGEGEKTLSSVEALTRSFARSGLARTDVVVAVGGGLVSDVAGFAAATYHRGVPYCTVATTLLAQVDAAIGGKTGVNLPEGKNLVGAYWQPTAVLCDTALLETLPEREWSSGRGEMAKYAFLGDGSDASNGSDASPASLAGLPLGEQIARCVAIKAAVVAADERESGRRALLNYGHTLAHALEAAALGRHGASGGSTATATATAGPDALRHGEAVAVGLVYAALLARRLGRIGDDRVAEHRRVVDQLGLAADLPAGSDPKELLWFMTRDKKAAHDLAFVLDGPHGLEVVHGVDQSDVLGTLEELACS